MKVRYGSREHGFDEPLIVRRLLEVLNIVPEGVVVSVNGELGQPSTMEGVFIRAPRIVRIGSGVRVLGRLGEDPVIVQQGRVVAASFHPELTADHRLHRLAVSLREECDG